MQAENQTRAMFKPTVLVRDVMADDPGVSRRCLVKKTKLVASEDAITRLEHAMNLPRQGQLLRDTPDPAVEIWATAVCNLPSATMKFILNAATDTLPNNSNLALWRKPVSASCKLCGEKQTLAHVLNHCSIALELRRYNHRHDAVLSIIADLVKTHLSPQQRMIVDLAETSYHYPQHIGSTDIRPEMVIWQDDPKQVHILELTVCFETNFDDAKRRKTCKYVELLEEAERHGYEGSLTTIEVGSRGILTISGLDRVKCLMNVERKEWFHFLLRTSQAAMLESHKTWTKRNWKDSPSEHHLS